MTNNGNDVEVGNSFVIYFKNFYKEPKMKIFTNLQKILNETTYQKTPLHCAVQGGNLDIVKFLFDKGADVESQNSYNEKPLHLAIKAGRLKIVKLLLDKGANIEVKNGKYQATPLHGAVENYRIDVVKLLLNRDANVNAEDKDNWTPLHYAADTNSLDIVKVLVDAHASLDARDDYGKTPLDIAKDKGHNNIVECLEKKLREERGKPLQRKRCYHNHLSSNLPTIDSSNQPEVAASSGIRPSSWINGLLSWVRSSIGRLFYSRAALPENNTTLPQVDTQVNVDCTILLLDVFIRKITGQKFVPSANHSLYPY